MKFGQLIEYKMRNICLEKPSTKYGSETCLRPFSGRSRLSIFQNQQSKVLHRLFLLYPRLRAIKTN